MVVGWIRNPGGCGGIAANCCVVGNDGPGGMRDCECIPTGVGAGENGCDCCLSSGKILSFEGCAWGGECNTEVNGTLLCCPGMGDRGGDRCIGALLG